MNFINDIGNFIRTYQNIDANKMNWENIIKDASVLGKKYPDHKQMILGILDDIEEKLTGKDVISSEVRKKYWNDFYKQLKQ